MVLENSGCEAGATFPDRAGHTWRSSAMSPHGEQTWNLSMGLKSPCFPNRSYTNGQTVPSRDRRVDGLQRCTGWLPPPTSRNPDHWAHRIAQGSCGRTHNLRQPHAMVACLCSTNSDWTSRGSGIDRRLTWTGKERLYPQR